MRWLSVFLPITIFKQISSLGTLIEVREIFGQKKMDLDGYPQTSNHYLKYWKKLINNYDLNKQKITQVLVLGLGGGNLATILEHEMPRANTTFVELEEEVVEVAKNFFGISENKMRKIVVSDAKIFMKKNITKYDLIIVDLYSGDDVPSFVSSRNFLNQIRNSLKKNGSTIFNYASHSFRKNDFLAFEAKLNTHFTNVKKINYVGHNFYLVSN